MGLATSCLRVGAIVGAFVVGGATAFFTLRRRAQTAGAVFGRVEQSTGVSDPEAAVSPDLPRDTALEPERPTEEQVSEHAGEPDDQPTPWRTPRASLIASAVMIFGGLILIGLSVAGGPPLAAEDGWILVDLSPDATDTELAVQYLVGNEGTELGESAVSSLRVTLTESGDDSDEATFSGTVAVSAFGGGRSALQKCTLSSSAGSTRSSVETVEPPKYVTAREGRGASAQLDQVEDNDGMISFNCAFADNYSTSGRLGERYLTLPSIVIRSVAPPSCVSRAAHGWGDLLDSGCEVPGAHEGVEPLVSEEDVIADARSVPTVELSEDMLAESAVRDQFLLWGGTALALGLGVIAQVLISWEQRDRRSASASIGTSKSHNERIEITEGGHSPPPGAS